MDATQSAKLRTADNAPAPEVTLRVGTLPDFASLPALYQAVYGSADEDGSSEAYYRWLYNDNPDGCALLGNAESGEELVGHYALVPLRLWRGGRESVGGVGVSALTRRDFQGRGLFARLVALVNETAVRQGLSLTYVVPSPQAHPWYVKLLRFTEQAPLGLWVRPLRTAPLLRARAGHARWLRAVSGVARVGDIAIAPLLGLLVARRNPYNLEVRTVDEFGADFDALWEQAKGSFSFAIVRTVTHLRWRFRLAPTRRYHIWGAYDQGRLVAYVIARVRTFRQLPGLTAGVIADLFASPDAVGHSGARLLVAQVLRWLAQQRISCCATELVSTAFEPAFRANGFFPVPRRFAEGRALLMRVLSTEHSLPADNTNLHFTGGDHDMG
ncbi:MAG: GNAT family N-acetyltransferase [Candidatus Binatia bacterium]